VEAQIADAADRVWRGLEAQDELWHLIHEHGGDPKRDPSKIGATRIAELTDYLYRTEHISRIPSLEPPKRRKRRRRMAD